MPIVLFFLIISNVALLSFGIGNALIKLKTIN